MLLNEADGCPAMLKSYPTQHVRHPTYKYRVNSYLVGFRDHGYKVRK